MEKVYYQIGHPASYGGVEKLRRATGSSRKKAQEFLARSDEYSEYRPARRRFTRRKTIARHQWEILQVDLADFQQESRINKGFRYVLVAIDILSKYVFYVALKKKKSQELQRAFNQIFRTAVPKMIHSDRGGEFTSKSMQDYFKRKGIHWYHTFSENKATLAERQIRTLRETLARIFQHQGNRKYFDILSKLADAYNNTRHSRTGMAPVEINKTNERQIFDKLFGGVRRTKLKPRYAVGDQVRISYVKGIFSKVSKRKWTTEIFTIKCVKLSDPIMYYLQDISGDEILGGFYEQELTRVIKTPADFWDIEKIIKKRKIRGKTQYYVKWKSYSDEHNSWVTDIKNK